MHEALSPIEESKPAPYILGSSIGPIKPYSTVHHCSLLNKAISEGAPKFC